MTASAFKMHHKEDPAAKITDAVGDLNDVGVMHNEVLVGVYLRPDALDLGGGKKLYLADGVRKEDEYQGKVGLVLKKGPLAFVSDSHADFAGQDVAVGQWVVFHSADGWSLSVHGVLCRMVKDADLRLTITSPDVVY